LTPLATSKVFIIKTNAVDGHIFLDTISTRSIQWAFPGETADFFPQITQREVGVTWYSSRGLQLQISYWELTLGCPASYSQSSDPFLFCLTYRPSGFRAFPASCHPRPAISLGKNQASISLRGDLGTQKYCISTQSELNAISNGGIRLHIDRCQGAGAQWGWETTWDCQTDAGH